MNLLGRVAGRVGGVAGRVGGAVFGEAKAALTAPVQSDESEVETLLQNISEGMMPEFRREAMAGLKELLTDNHKAQLAFGHMGIPILVNVLCDDREDLDLVRGALETLVVAMSSTAEDPTAPEPPPGAINSELFSRRPDHVSLLLTLLEDEPVGINDFYVRYYTVQLLTSLLQACSYKLQEAILASPMGVVRLMDMLMEREVIRNEALQLLVVLTRQNEEVQKIAAFEGAFERIFNIVREEGGADGGVVVQDSLELLNNLLRKNAANQRLFREMGYASNLTQLLGSVAALPPTAGDEADGSVSISDLARHFAGGPATVTPLPRQKAAIMLCALEAALLLVAAPSSLTEEAMSVERSNRVSNQSKLLQVGLLEALLPLCLTDGGLPSVSVRSQAFCCMGDLIGEQPTGQEKLGASRVRTRVGNTPVLQAALRVSLYAEESRERKAAEALISNYCRVNPEGQAALAATITAPLKPRTGSLGGYQAGGEQGGSTFGSELVVAITSMAPSAYCGMQVSCRGASVLQHLLVDNPNTKERVLAIPIEWPLSPHAPPNLLLPRIMRQLSDSLRSGEQGRLAAALYLRLLIVWLRDCPPAVSALLDGAPHLPLLVDLANGRLGGGDATLPGLSALVLGLCLLHGKPVSGSASTSAPPYTSGGLPLPGAKPSSSIANTSDTVMSVLLSRVGLTQFFHRLEDLRKCPMFVAASSMSTLPKPMSRAAAAAATAGDSGIAEEQERGEERPSKAANRPEVHVEESPFDLQFTLFVGEVEAGVRAQALEAFAQPTRRNGSQGETGTGWGSETTTSSLTGTSDTERLQHAEDLIQCLEAEVSELRNRNRSLVEDTFKAGGAPPADGSTLRPGSGPTDQRPPLASQHGLGGPPPSAAEVEARVAAELRASRAEREATSVRQQVELLHARLATAERSASEAQAHAAQATSAAAKHESDLRELSRAYNTIESHSFQLEAQLRELQGKLTMSQQAALAAQQGLHTAQAQLQEAKTTQAPTAGPSGVSEEEVAKRVEEAAAEAKAEAEAEAEEQLTDLLVCLGQEETKVAALGDKLRSMGVNVDEMIDAIMAEAADEDES